MQKGFEALVDLQHHGILWGLHRRGYIRSLCQEIASAAANRRRCFQPRRRSLRSRGLPRVSPKAPFGSCQTTGVSITVSRSSCTCFLLDCPCALDAIFVVEPQFRKLSYQSRRRDRDFLFFVRRAQMIGVLLNWVYGRAYTLGTSHASGGGHY